MLRFTHSIIPQSQTSFQLFLGAVSMKIFIISFHKRNWSFARPGKDHVTLISPRRFSNFSLDFSSTTRSDELGVPNNFIFLALTLLTGFISFFI